MKKFNINEWMWLGVLGTYVLYFASLLGNGKIALFIHPKMNKYIIFTIVIFILLIHQQLKILKRTGSKKFKYSYLIFLLPILLVVIVNPSTLNAKVTANKGVKLTQDNNITTEMSVPTELVQPNAPDLNVSTEPLNDEPYSSPTYNTEDGFRFLDTVNEISTDLDNLLGQERELEGFIYLDETFDSTQFVVSRYTLSCCAADAQILGILCAYSGDFEFTSDQWVKVTGIVDKIMYKGIYENEEIEMAQLRVTQIETITAPQEQYVYPY